MKKFLCVFITAVLLCGLLPAVGIQAAEDWEIPEGVIIPSPDTLPVTERLSMYHNFDGISSRLSWYSKTPTTVGDTGTNHVGKMGAGETATYALGMSQMRLTNHVIRCNMKFNYHPVGSYPNVLNLFYTNDANRVRLAFYSDGSSKYQVLVQQYTSNTKRTESYKTLPQTVFQGNWVFLKITIIGNSLALYINSEDTPYWEYVLPLNGGSPWLTPATIAFQPGVSTLFIDNLMVSKIVDLPDPESVPVPTVDSSKYTVLYQDFESMETGNLAELKSYGYNEIKNTSGVDVTSDTDFTGELITEDSNKAYNFKGSYSVSDLKLPADFNMEMNIKFDYRYNSKDQFSAAPQISFNRYYLNGKEYCYRIKFSTDVYEKSYVTMQKVEGDTVTNLTPVTLPDPAELYTVDANDIWAYFKIERTGDQFLLYFNDKENPFAAYIDSEETPLLSGGGIEFKSYTAPGDAGTSARKMGIDNLYISTTEFPEFSLVVTDCNLRLDESGDADAVICDVTVDNQYNRDYDTNFILAAYDGSDCLAGITIMPCTVPASIRDGKGWSLPEPLRIEIDYPNAYTYKLFVWEQGSMKPLGLVLFPTI